MEGAVLPARAGGPALGGSMETLGPPPVQTDMAQSREGWERGAAWAQPPDTSCSMHRAAGRTGQAAPAQGLAVNLHSRATSPEGRGPARHRLSHSGQRAPTQLHPACLRNHHGPFPGPQRDFFLHCIFSWLTL